jgi:hypothetical protein
LTAATKPEKRIYMKQLVGTRCLICREQIGSILEGKFCPACASPVHVKCAKAERGSSTSERCSICGVNAADAAAFDAGSRRSSDDLTAPPPGDLVLTGLRAFRAIRWIIGGVACIWLGVWLMIDPNFKSHPRLNSLSDLVPGLAALVAGVGLIALSVYQFRRLK